MNKQDSQPQMSPERAKRAEDGAPSETVSRLLKPLGRSKAVEKRTNKNRSVLDEGVRGGHIGQHDVKQGTPRCKAGFTQT